MANVTREFSVEQLVEEIEVTRKHDGILIHEEWDKRRWYIVRRVVFEFEGNLWEIFYNEPSTEIQEDQDLFDEDPVTAYQVAPVQVSVTHYRRIGS